MDPPLEALRAAPVEDTARLDGGSGSSSELDGDRKGNAGRSGGVRKTATEKVAAAQILALAHGCCQVELGRKEFSTVATIRALLRMVLVWEPEMRTWALRVCRETLPWQEPSVVDDQFRYGCALSTNLGAILVWDEQVPQMWPRLSLITRLME